jgi:RNA polymerase sigma-70 factor (sigma-E family)
VDDQAREDFRSYVAARSPALLRTAYALTGNRADAEDLLQTALAKTYLSWERIREREAVDGYVRRVMVNTRTSWWRRRKVDERPAAELPEQPDGRDAVTDLALHDALWTALAGLPKRQRAMVVLRYYEDLSEAETAAVMGVSVGTVKSTTSRALASLRGASGLHDDPRLSLPTETAGARS